MTDLTPDMLDELAYEARRDGHYTTAKDLEDIKTAWRHDRLAVSDIATINAELNLTILDLRKRLEAAEKGNCICGARAAIPHNPWCPAALKEANDG